MDYQPSNKLGLKFQEIADPKSLAAVEGTRGIVNEILSRFKSFQLPKVFNVQGNVSVDSPVFVENLNELKVPLKSLEAKVEALSIAMSSAKSPEIKFPKIEFPKMEGGKIDISPLVKQVEKLEEAIKKNKIELDFPTSIAVNNFPPQKIPQPVTHLSINALQGIVKTTAMTLTTSAAVIPTAALADRRSIMVYNNSANTIYLGGSDVTTSNGLPIPAASYSPSLDLGKNSFVYGVAGSSSDIRVMEVSDEASGR